jgi:hypothetical protein
LRRLRRDTFAIHDGKRQCFEKWARSAGFS